MQSCMPVRTRRYTAMDCLMATAFAHALIGQRFSGEHLGSCWIRKILEEAKNNLGAEFEDVMNPRLDQGGGRVKNLLFLKGTVA
jgi:hypothetical protein